MKRFLTIFICAAMLFSCAQKGEGGDPMTEDEVYVASQIAF